tara:strand:+ start:1383 stop:1940 length:558 start_codon:yes stop_codon:yes gene_type:complete
MAIRTTSASGGGGQYNAGWHTLIISKAEYGSWKGPKGDKRYLDIWFKDYPDNMNLRVYEAFSNDEEFKIANIFKYANAGIIDVLEDSTGKKRIQFDDEANGLIGKTVNVFFYKETKTGNGYSRVFDSIAPIEQEGEKLSYSADAVESIKKSVAANCEKRNAPQDDGDDFFSNPETETTKTETAGF